MINPTNFTALQSLDFGSVYTPDGREHPVTAFSLPFLANLTNPANSQPTSSYAIDPPTTYPATGVNVPAQGSATSQATLSNANFDLGGMVAKFTPAHFGARLVVGIVAIIILAIVVVRLLK